MKRIVRLTERDLSRIVRRVLKESTEEPIKVKVFSLTDKQMTQRDCNIEVTNLKVVGSRIDFNFKIPGNGWCSLKQVENLSIDLPPIGEASINCGDSKRRIEFGNENDFDYQSLGLLSKAGYAKLSAKCDAYVSIENDDMINNNFV